MLTDENIAKIEEFIRDYQKTDYVVLGRKWGQGGTIGTREQSVSLTISVLRGMGVDIPRKLPVAPRRQSRHSLINSVFEEDAAE